MAYGNWNTFMSSGGIRSDRFKTYDEALKHYTETKPIRGRSPELRPLGNNRSYTQCQITHDPLTQTVSAKLYDTECVTIGHDGVIKLTRGGWISPTTANFIDAVLPNEFGSVYLFRRKLIYKTRGGKEYEIPKEGLLLQVSPNWDEADVIATQATVNKVQYEYKANRKVMNQIRKTYAGFLSTLDVMSAMSVSYDIAEYCEYFPNLPLRYIDAENEHNKQQVNSTSTHKWAFNGGWNMRHILDKYAALPRMSVLPDLSTTIQAFNYGDDTNTWLKEKANRILTEDLPRFMQALQDGLSEDVRTLRKLMLMIVANGNNYPRGAGGYGNQEEMTIVPSTFGDVAVPRMWYEVNGSQIENYFIDLIKYVYADLIFTKVEVPSGTMPKLTNNKYVVVNEFLAKNTDIVTERHVVV